MNKLTILLLMLASSIAINVYSQTVSLDDTFGQDGRTIVPNTSEISFFDFDNHGNIIAVGYTMKPGVKYDLTIVKTNVDGTIDESFGNGGVTKVTDYDECLPLGLKITNDNKIVVIGSFTKVQFQGRETIIMRFNEDGTVDEDFGDNGKVNLNFNGSIMSLNLESDDFMLIAKSVYQDENRSNTIEKYDYEGQLDESFGESGIVLLTNSILPGCMKILNNGSIIVAGIYNTFPNTELGICKLTPDGELDTDFANDGIWHKDIMQDFDLSYEFFRDVFEDSEGNLLLLGWGNCSFLSKFSPNGIFDTSFGEDGFYCFDSFVIHKLITQIGDKYLVAGCDRTDDRHPQIAIVNNDGSSANVVYTSGIYFAVDMKLQGNNKIILGGRDKIDDISYFALERVVIDSETYAKLNYSSNDLIIFPNPVKENLYFSNETAFEIFDIQGRILLTSSTPVKSVNIGSLGAGVYFIRFGNSVQKFVKE